MYEQEPNLTTEKCPACFSPMLARVGRNGPFLGCSKWPKCNGARKVERGMSLTKCPSCGAAAGAMHKTGCKRFYEADAPTWTHTCTECNRTVTTVEPWGHADTCSQWVPSHGDLKAKIAELEAAVAAAAEARVAEAGLAEHEAAVRRFVEMAKKSEEESMTEKTQDAETQGPSTAETKPKLTPAEQLKSHVFHGLKVGVADEASDLMLDMAKALLGDAYPELLKTETGKDFLKLVVSMGLFYAADQYPEMIPMADGLKNACGLVVEATSRDLLQPKLKALRPTLERLAAVGTAAAKGQIRVTDEDTRSRAEELPVETVKETVSNGRSRAAVNAE